MITVRANKVAPHSECK